MNQAPWLLEGVSQGREVPNMAMMKVNRRSTYFTDATLFKPARTGCSGRKEERSI
jgi:hypothetical protein